MIVIYMINSPSGKVYIGQTKNFDQRMKHYRCINRKSGQVKLRNSILKYGAENHTSCVIDIAEGQQDASTLEKFYIGIYDSVKQGLNCNDNTSWIIPIGHDVTIETRRKISAKIIELYKNPAYKSDRFKKRSSETIRKMSEYRLTHPVEISDETRAKMSRAKKGGSLSQETKMKLSMIRRGKKNLHLRILSNERILEIRSLLHTGMKCSKIEILTGVKQRTILRIKHNQIYKEVR